MHHTGLHMARLGRSMLLSVFCQVRVSGRERHSRPPLSIHANCSALTAFHSGLTIAELCGMDFCPMHLAIPRSKRSDSLLVGARILLIAATDLTGLKHLWPTICDPKIPQKAGKIDIYPCSALVPLHPIVVKLGREVPRVLRHCLTKLGSRQCRELPLECPQARKHMTR